VGAGLTRGIGEDAVQEVIEAICYEPSI
jgi:hypothetical protein